MNEHFPEEDLTPPSDPRDAAVTHALASPAFVAKCIDGALKEPPRKGQGRREARHGRRKRP